MNTYSVRIYGHGWTWTEEFKADSAEEAIAKAKQFRDKRERVSSAEKI